MDAREAAAAVDRCHTRNQMTRVAALRQKLSPEAGYAANIGAMLDAIAPAFGWRKTERRD